MILRTVGVVLILAAGLRGQAQDADRSMVAITPGPYVPLTGHERLKRYLKDTVDPIAFLRSGASAGFGQLRDRPKEWGEGAEGFGRRFASSYAEHLTYSTLVFGLSSLLHEDNRYLPSQETTTSRRIRYALESSVLARHDDGTRHVSISKLTAFVGAAFISRTWQPHSSRGVGGAISNVGTTMGVAAGFDVLREFLPDLLHRK